MSNREHYDQLTRRFGAEYAGKCEALSLLLKQADHIDGPARCECTENLCSCEPMKAPNPMTKTKTDSALNAREARRLRNAEASERGDAAHLVTLSDFQKKPKPVAKAVPTPEPKPMSSPKTAREAARVRKANVSWPPKEEVKEAPLEWNNVQGNVNEIIKIGPTFTERVRVASDPKAERAARAARGRDAFKAPL